jgi:hypothetical protein
MVYFIFRFLLLILQSIYTVKFICFWKPTWQIDDYHSTLFKITVLENDCLIASAIILVGFLSGLNYRSEHEEDPNCTIQEEINTSSLSVFEISGMTVISNWRKRGK